MFVEEVSREYVTELEELENIVFKGKGHLKRGFGIQEFPKKKINKNFFQYIYKTLTQ